MGFCYSSHTQKKTRPCQKPLIKNMWTTITYGWYWCSNGVFSPYSFMINHSCQCQLQQNLQATWQYPDLWLHSHLACRRAPSWFWMVVNPKTTRAIFSCGKGHVEMKGGLFSWKSFWCFPVFQNFFCQKPCSTERFQDQIPAYLQPWNVASRTEKNIKQMLHALANPKRKPNLQLFLGSYRRPDDSNSPTVDSAPKKGNDFENEHKPLDPKTMKNEGFRPQISGSQPLNVKVGGLSIFEYLDTVATFTSPFGAHSNCIWS